MKTDRKNLSRAAVAALALLGVSMAAHGSAPFGRYTVSTSSVLDNQTHLTWQKGVSPTAMTWTDALAYCTGLTLDGATWRAPRLKELQSLVDPTASLAGPSIAEPPFTNTPFANNSVARMWTSTIWVPNGGNSAFTVEFSRGTSNPWPLVNTAQIRCVH